VLLKKINYQIETLKEENSIINVEEEKSYVGQLQEEIRKLNKSIQNEKVKSI
jgi:hypothetical protein